LIVIALIARVSSGRPTQAGNQRTRHAEQKKRRSEERRFFLIRPNPATNPRDGQARFTVLSSVSPR